MVDDRRARIRRNMARAWAYAAAAYAASVSSVTNVQYDFAGGSVAIGTTYGDYTTTLAVAGPPALTPQSNNFGIARTVGATEYHTTASLSIGTASANRRVIMVGVMRGATINNMVKASIGGVAATIHFGGGGSPIYGFVLSADVPTGTIVSFSASWSGGFTNQVLEGRVYTADKSLFENPSPTIANSTGFVSLTLNVTNSSNAVIAYAGTREAAIQQNGTLSSANVVLTTYQPAGWLQWGYANSVTAQTSTFEYRCLTASESVALVVMAWR